MCLVGRKELLLFSLFCAILSTSKVFALKKGKNHKNRWKCKMLKNPYVSRVFGHLFDLVRLVMQCASFKTIWTTKTSTHSIHPSTRTEQRRLIKIRINKKEQMVFLLLLSVWHIGIYFFNTFLHQVRLLHLGHFKWRVVPLCIAVIASLYVGTIS